MRTKDIIEGLTILEKYRSEPDGYNTGAEHDQIYAYATDSPVSEEDVKRLVELGWFQPDVEIGRPESDSSQDFSIENYDPSERWSCFV